MKKIIFSAFIVLLSFILHAQTFHQLSYKTINGDTISLSSFSGKKLLVIVLPFTQTDSIYSQLQQFRNRYADTVVIVGVLSIDDGYQPSMSSNILNIYAGISILPTEAMYTKKSAGSNQSELLSWLTNRTKNKHFDMDSKGIGHKFFVNESGRLYAVLPPQLPLSSNIIDKVVHAGSQ